MAQSFKALLLYPLYCSAHAQTYFWTLFLRGEGGGGMRNPYVERVRSTNVHLAMY